MKKRSYFWLLIALYVSYGCSSGSETKIVKKGEIPAIDSLINRSVQQNHIAGAVIRVQQDDSILHRKAYGYARKYNMKLQLVDHPEKMTPGHMFDLASLTKVCGTTFGIMMMVDQGKMHPDDPISKWLPEFGKGEKRRITIRNLLTHSAGLYKWKPTYYYASDKQQLYKYISQLPLKWAVGEGRHYSDLGFILLGDIIERISGQPLDKYLEKHLYFPLGMNHTTFNPLRKGFKKIAATSHGNLFEHHMVYDDDFGYTVDANPKSWDGWRRYTLHGEVNDGNAWYTMHGVAGHAGLFSTADDLQKLVNLLLNKGKYQGRQIISAAVIDTFLTKNQFGNGLGWAMNPAVIHAKGTPAGTFGHTGFTGTNIVAIPKYDLSVILLTNRQNVPPQPSGYYYNLGPLRQKIVDAVLKSLHLLKH